MLTFDEVAQRLSATAFHRLLGLELDAIEPYMRIALNPSAALEGRPGSSVLHGGLLATLVDTSGSLAVIAAQGGASVATIDLLIDYHRPAMLQPLMASAEIVKLGRTISTTRTTITDAEGRLVASGRCTFVPVSG